MATAIRGQATTRCHEAFFARTWAGMRGEQRARFSRCLPREDQLPTFHKLQLDQYTAKLRANNDELWKRAEQIFNVKITTKERPSRPGGSQHQLSIHGEKRGRYRVARLLSRMQKEPDFDLGAALDLESRWKHDPLSDYQTILDRHQTPHPASFSHVHEFLLDREQLAWLVRADGDILRRLQSLYSAHIDISDLLATPSDSPRVTVRAYANNAEANYETRDHLAALVEDDRLRSSKSGGHIAFKTQNVSNHKYKLLNANNRELASAIARRFDVQIKPFPAEPPLFIFPLIRIVGQPNDISKTRQFLMLMGRSVNDTNVKDFTADRLRRVENVTDKSPTTDVTRSNEKIRDKWTLTDVVPTVKESYKLVMRNVVSNAVVLTTYDIDDSQNLRAMTVSSMTSVTLDPVPIVSFSIRRPSRTFDAIIKNQTFLVNFLASTEKGARIAHAFAQPHDDPSRPFHTLRMLGLAKMADDKPGLKTENVPAQFECKVLSDKSVEVGDHTVIFAEVVKVYTLGKRRKENFKYPFLGYVQAVYRKMPQETVLTLPELQKPFTPKPSTPKPPRPLDNDASWLSESRAPKPKTTDGSEEDMMFAAELEAERQRLESFDEQHVPMAAGEYEDVVSR